MTLEESLYLTLEESLYMTLEESLYLTLEESLYLVYTLYLLQPFLEPLSSRVGYSLMLLVSLLESHIVQSVCLVESLYLEALSSRASI